MERKAYPEFYRQIFKLLIPIVIQNMLNAAVSSADVLMLSFVGQSAISAVSLASNYAGVLFSINCGLGTGVTMLTAQYYGKGDLRAIRAVEGIALRLGLVFSLVFGGAALLIPRWMMLLFTNDGELMQRLIHPKFEVDKLYRVTVRGDWEKGTALLRQMRSLEGEVIAPAQGELVSGESEQAVLRITIHQGKNRQIRRMCKQAGLTVLRLERLAEHGILLGNLPCGKWRALTDFEVRKLKGSDENDP